MRDIFRSIFKTIEIIIEIYLTKKLIILGPFHGEFGFEIIYNQSLYNSLKLKFHNRIKVASKKSSRNLYSDIENDNYINFEYDLKKAGYAFGNVQDVSTIHKKFLAENFVSDKKNIILLDLSENFIPLIKLFFGFKYIPLTKSKRSDKKICFHFRNIIKNGNDNRDNFTQINAYKLVEYFNKKNYNTVCIGDLQYSYAPININKDKRSNNLKDTIDELGSSIVCIGQLSGPIHLAQMCSTPIITWAEGEWRFNIFPEWNPLNSDLYVVDKSSFNPELNSIVKLFEENYE
jgi:hypothetical protein